MSLQSEATTVRIPQPNGESARVLLHAPSAHPHTAAPATSREVYAAVHVVADPWTASAAAVDAIDWDATIAVRKRMWRLGLGVADAMDTAQRGGGLGWSDAKTLIGRTLESASSEGGRTVVGIVTDQLAHRPASVSAIIDAYLEQLEFVETRGGTAVMMASRQLAASAAGPEDYFAVYDAVLTAATRPVVLHWLGTVFDPALAGYWGFADTSRAADTVVALVESHASRVAGIKMSLLDEHAERAVRDRLPRGVRMFTGDDFNYVSLMEPDADGRFSDALLGAFAAVPRYAAAALQLLDAGDTDGFRRTLGPTQDLARLVFATPTQYYKAGVVWLAYLDGLQSHYRLIGGLESGRSLAHLVRVWDAANSIGYFDDPEAAAGRLLSTLAAQGITP